jgi:ubiquinone/menaquinone biosynthesis C-methylase UbiE
MEPIENSVEHHYGHGGILNGLLQALKEHGKNIDALTPDDLAPVDEFHLRGREGTVELANRIDWQPGLTVLDVGCGIGGSSRFLANRYGAKVSGIDLTHEFIDAAISLTKMVGLDGSINFQQGSALEMPFPDESFDIAWTEHVQMNIESKRKFYGEIWRVLKPGGRFLFHDIFRLGEQPPDYPMPWAEDPSYSFLASPELIEAIIESLGMRFQQWEDTTLKTLEWFAQNAEKAKQAGGPILSPMIVMGESAKKKMENLRHSLGDSRLCTIQGVAQK